MRILIVEDEQRIANDIAEAVSGGGYVPEIVGDGEDAWFQGGTEAYAAIILDLGLPDGNGVDFIRDFRGWSSTPIVVLSARAGEADKIEALDAGNNALSSASAVPLARLLASDNAKLHLRELSVYMNELRDDGVEAIAPALACCGGLRVLDLGGNEVTARGAEALAAAVGERLAAAISAALAADRR